MGMNIIALLFVPQESQALASALWVNDTLQVCALSLRLIKPVSDVFLSSV
jgi:hypothetical protein